MKKILLMRLMTVIVLLSTALFVAAQQPYAVLSNSNKTLTFYYDDQKDSRGGMSVELHDGNPLWYSHAATISTVVFDTSFSNCHTITSTARWFYFCSELATITGIENLNTENVTNMSYMFQECHKLTSLDVTGFNTSKVTDMSGMFMGVGLTTIDLSHFDTSNVTDMKDLFYGSEGLTNLDLSSFNTSKVEDMSSMFWQCFGLESVNLSSFDTRNVRSMANMFINCKKLKSLNLSNFDTGNVTNMYSMFAGCENLTSLDVKNFNTGKVNNMGMMFSDLTSLTTLDLTNFDTWKVTNMYAMFYGCSALNTIYCNDTWRASTSSARMFNDCTSLPNFSSGKVDVNYAKPVADGGYFTPIEGYTPEPYAVFEDGTLTFYYDGHKENREGFGVGPFTSSDVRWDGHALDITKVVFDVLFAKCTTLTSTAYWFCNCKDLTAVTGLENLKTANVTDMTGMFKNSAALSKLDLRNFDIGKVMSFNEMFQGCSNLAVISSDDSWVGSTATSDNMFSTCLSLPGYNKSKVDVSYAKSIADGGYFTSSAESVAKEPYAVLIDGTLTFYYDRKKAERNGLRIGPFSSIYTSWGRTMTKVVFDKSMADCHTITSLDYWFYGCNKLESIIGLEYLDTRNVTGMGALFSGCSKLKSLDLTGFNTEKVYSMSSMFNGCSSLTILDLSSFSNAQVQNMSSMFDCCTNLKTIIVGSGWGNITPTITFLGNDMFRSCTSLVGGAGTSYDENHTDYVYARVDKNGQPGYFTGKSSAEVTQDEPYAVLSEDNTILSFYYDGNKNSRGGLSLSPEKWGMHNGDITTVIFTPSFARCTSVTSTDYWFSGCTNLTTFIGMENFNTGNVKTMYRMFGNCSALTSIDLSHFDTGKVTNMQYMFEQCSGLTKIDVTGFNTSSVKYFDFMFSECNNLASLDVRNFNTGSMESASGMFYKCENLEFIYCNDTWEPKQEADIMFKNCLSLYGYSVDNINDASFAKPIPDGGYFTPDGWNVQEAGEEEAYAVYDNGTLTFFYDHQREIRGGFSVGPFTDDLTVAWAEKALSVTSVVFDESFSNCATITSTAYWFSNCENLQSFTGLNYFKTNNVTDMSGMFKDCHALTSLDLSGFNTDNVTNIHRMFYGCSGLTSLDLSEFKTDNITSSMESLFYNCSGLKSINLSGFKTDNKTDLSSMFYGCTSLETIDLSSFKTDNVTKMNNMFEGCSSLKALDLSNFNTANVTEMSKMFYNCSTLATIFVDEEKWTINAVTSGNEMFGHCTNLVGGRGTVYDENYIDITYARIDKYGQPGYLKDIESLNDSEAYVVVNGNTVTFYYDSKKAKRGGSDINNRQNNSAYCNTKKVVFDSSFADYRPTSTAYWFYNCRYLTTFTGMEFLNTEDVTNMGYMFHTCEKLENVDVSNFNTEKVTSMQYMFSECYALQSLDLSNFNTENVENMTYMFYECRVLASLYLTKFNTVKVTNLRSMFKDCWKLKTIYCNNTWSCNDSYNMFGACYELVGAIPFNSGKTDVTYANPVTGYFTANVIETRCAKPDISMKDGKLILSCETEGVEFESQIEPLSTPLIEGTTISLPKLYRVTVYAKKEGLEDSEPGTIDVEMNTGSKGDVDDDGVVDIADAVRIVNLVVGKITELAPKLETTSPMPE